MIVILDSPRWREAARLHCGRQSMASITGHSWRLSGGNSRRRPRCVQSVDRRPNK
jgi:hypothetical protein